MSYLKKGKTGRRVLEFSLELGFLGVKILYFCNVNKLFADCLFDTEKSLHPVTAFSFLCLSMSLCSYFLINDSLA